MYKTISRLIFALAVFTMAACDDGAVDETIDYQQAGRNVNLRAQLTGLDTWPSSHYVALAAFNDESEYALSARRITSVGEDGTLDMTLSGISDEATRVEVCVLNTLRQRVATFATLDEDAMKSTAETIPFEAGTLNVSMLSAVQTSIFNTTCIGCHSDNSRSGVPSAGLWLTEGKSHDALVGQPSKKVEGSNLVEPGDPEASVLYNLLTVEGYGTGWYYKHANEVVDSRRLTLVREWILAGAKE